MRRPALTGVLVAAAAALAPASASADLSLVGQWGSPGTGPGQFNVPGGVAADGAGNVYVADGNNDRVERFDSNGHFILSFGGPGSGNVQFNGPGHLGLDPQGNVLVDDEGHYRVQKISPRGAFLTQYGSFGSGPGQFRGNPRGVAADGAGNVYVIDSGAGGKIDKYAPDGTFLTSWGIQGSGPGQWNTPRGLEVDPAGNVYVGDADNHRVDVFTGDGTFVRSFGTSAQLGFTDEVALDSHGNVFVADDAPAAIVEFDAQGNYLGSTTNTGNAGDPFRPYSVSVGAGDQVYATDTGKSRVLRFTEAPPPPQLGKTADVAKVTGTVKVRLAGMKTFTNVTKDSTIPLGSTIDTTREGSSIGLSLAKPKGTGTQTGTFSQGQFKVTQVAKGSQAGLTQMTLSGGGNFSSCKAKVAVGAARRRPHRSLFSSVHGRFRTRGRASTATVRGTQWLEKDTCAGTLTQVRRGTVIVHDFAKHKNVRVKAGHKYMALVRALKKKKHK